MATRFILSAAAARPVAGLTFPDFNNDSADREFLEFDPDNDETAQWPQGIIPQGAVGPWTAYVYGWMFSGNTGSVRGQMSIECITYDADAIAMSSTSSFDTANSAGANVPGTAGDPFIMTITLTNMDNFAVGDGIRFRFNRDADGTSGTDNAPGLWRVDKIEIRDSA